MRRKAVRALIGWIIATGMPGTVAAAVMYDVEFEGLWNETQVVGSLPGFAHFTALVGATHDGSGPLWAPGELASEGIENVAELGNSSALSSEIAARINAGTAGSSVALAPIFNFPGSTTNTIEVEEAFPYLSLISMVAPSPDWFVGVYDLSLRDASGWIEQITVDLRPWDAGTEEGSAFSLRNPASNPHVAISALSGSPFVGSPVIGRLHLTLVPEPSTGLMLALGLGVLAMRRGRGPR